MRRIAVFSLLVLAVTLTSAVWAYEYHGREDLSDKLEKKVGKQVKVIDEIISIYPDTQNVDGYFKFDTLYFRCLIPNDKTEAIDYVKETGTLTKKGSRRVKRLVTIEGTVERREVYGEVKGKEAGVESEQIVLIVDSAKKPRARYYRDID